MKLTRRRALLGLGTAAAVSGGVLGTGALTSVQAKRTIDVDVEGDNSAFVGLYDTSGGGFVDMNNGTLRIRLNDDVGSSSGLGVNHGTGGGDVATTTLDPAFTLKNQGANTMYVQFTHDGNTASGNDVQFVGDDRADGNSNAEDDTAGDVIATTNNLAFIDRSDSDGDGSLSDEAVTANVHSGGTATSIDEAGYVKMATGEAIDVVLQVASDTTTTGDIISTATIEAFSSSSAGGLVGTQITSA